MDRVGPEDSVDGGWIATARELASSMAERHGRLTKWVTTRLKPIVKPPAIGPLAARGTLARAVVERANWGTSLGARASRLSTGIIQSLRAADYRLRPTARFWVDRKQGGVETTSCQDWPSTELWADESEAAQPTSGSVERSPALSSWTLLDETVHPADEESELPGSAEVGPDIGLGGRLFLPSLDWAMGPGRGSGIRRTVDRISRSADTMRLFEPVIPRSSFGNMDWASAPGETETATPAPVSEAPAPEESIGIPTVEPDGESPNRFDVHLGKTYAVEGRMTNGVPAKSPGRRRSTEVYRENAVGITRMPSVAIVERPSPIRMKADAVAGLAGEILDRHSRSMPPVIIPPGTAPQPGEDTGRQRSAAVQRLPDDSMTGAEVYIAQAQSRVLDSTTEDVATSPSEVISDWTEPAATRATDEAAKPYLPQFEQRPAAPSEAPSEETGTARALDTEAADDVENARMPERIGPGISPAQPEVEHSLEPEQDEMPGVRVSGESQGSGGVGESRAEPRPFVTMSFTGLQPGVLRRSHMSRLAGMTRSEAALDRGIVMRYSAGRTAYFVMSDQPRAEVGSEGQAAHDADRVHGEWWTAPVVSSAAERESRRVPRPPNVPGGGYEGGRARSTSGQYKAIVQRMPSPLGYASGDDSGETDSDWIELVIDEPGAPDMGDVAGTRPGVVQRTETPERTQRRQAESGDEDGGEGPDLERLAREVYAIIRRRLAVERERIGCR